MSILDKAKLKDTFNKFSNTAKNTAENVVNATKEGASTVAKKSGELVEISKLTVNINSLESNIKKIHGEIGSIIADKHEKGIYIDPELVSKCDEILKFKNDINEMQTKISKLKAKKICPNCKHEVESEIKFCPHCGAEIPLEEENTPESSNVILGEEVETIEAEIVDDNTQSEECPCCQNSEENTECECNCKDNKTEE